MLEVSPFREGNAAAILLVAQAQLRVISGLSDVLPPDVQAYAVAFWLARVCGQAERLERLFASLTQKAPPAPIPCPGCASSAGRQLPPGGTAGQGGEPTEHHAFFARRAEDRSCDEAWER